MFKALQLVFKRLEGVGSRHLSPLLEPLTTARAALRSSSDTLRLRVLAAKEIREGDPPCDGAQNCGMQFNYTFDGARLFPHSKRL